MKKITSVLVSLLFAGIAFSQNQFQILPDKNGGNFYKGLISREALESDTSFKWYAENLKGYIPNATAVAGLNKNADSIQLITFMGTWCSDSHFVIPKFFSLTDAAGFPKERITLIAVDREKKTISHLAEALNITNVPTIIVMKNGKEVGRVIEYGKYGLFDKELGEIINTISN